jgi:hypothetical protein
MHGLRRRILKVMCEHPCTAQPAGAGKAPRSVWGGIAAPAAECELVAALLHLKSLVGAG